MWKVSLESPRRETLRVETSCEKFREGREMDKLVRVPRPWFFDDNDIIDPRVLHIIFDLVDRWIARSDSSFELPVYGAARDHRLFWWLQQHIRVGDRVDSASCALDAHYRSNKRARNSLIRDHAFAIVCDFPGQVSGRHFFVAVRSTLFVVTA